MHRTPSPSFHRILRTGLVVSASIAMLGLAACGSDDDSESSSTGATPAAGNEDLAGRTFLSTEVDGFNLVAGTRVSLTFDDVTLAANAGCNTAVGGYTFDNDILAVGTLAQTKMACSEELTAQDDWLVSILQFSPATTLDGNEMVITSDAYTIHLTDSSEIAANELDGTSWKIDALVVDGTTTPGADGAE